MSNTTTETVDAVIGAIDGLHNLILTIDEWNQSLGCDEDENQDKDEDL